MTKSEELYNIWKSLSYKERNDLLQAKFSAYIDENDIDEFTLDIFKVLVKSFNTSVKLQEIEGSNDDELFSKGNVDIKNVREDSQ